MSIRNEAIKRGAKTFIPANPCDNGHRERYTSNGMCVQCLKNKARVKAEAKAKARAEARPVAHAAVKQMSAVREATHLMAQRVKELESRLSTVETLTARVEKLERDNHSLCAFVKDLNAHVTTLLKQTNPQS